MSLENDVKALLAREENAGTLLAGYLTGCLNAFEPNSWQQAVAIASSAREAGAIPAPRFRAEWDRNHPGR